MFLALLLQGEEIDDVRSVSIFADAFWLTVFLIFVIAIASALLRLRERDKCLKLLDGHRVSYLGGRAQTLWGSLSVLNRGLELFFDRPRTDARDITKSSTLLYEPEYGNAIALCRVRSGSSDEKLAERKAQVESTFDPSKPRRFARAARNVVYTIRDAFTRTLGTITGHFAGVRGSAAIGRAVASQSEGIGELGQSVVSYVGNAYEQLLERQIGKQVVLELDAPPGSGTTPLELPGYLVDYTERFLAVFNVEQEALEEFEMTFTGSRDERGVRARVERGTLTITSRHSDPIVITRVAIGEEHTDLGVCLLKGCEVTLPCKDASLEISVGIEVTRTIDVICPRASARIRFGGGELPENPAGWVGSAPGSVGSVTRSSTRSDSGTVPAGARSAGTEAVDESSDPTENE